MRIDSRSIDPATAQTFGYSVDELIAAAAALPETEDEFLWRSTCAVRGIDFYQWRQLEQDRIARSGKVPTIEQIVHVATHGFYPKPTNATVIRRDYPMEHRAAQIQRQAAESFHDATRALSNLGICLRPLPGEHQLLADQVKADLAPLVNGMLRDLEMMAAVVAKTCGSDHMRAFDSQESDINDWS